MYTFFILKHYFFYMRKYVQMYIKLVYARFVNIMQSLGQYIFKTKTYLCVTVTVFRVW